jgi:cephalosporin hydroxylase
MRQAVIDRIWRGLDPLTQAPQNLVAIDLQGWNSQHVYLAQGIAELQPSIVVEIGVWKGGSTIFMADRMRAAGQTGVVIAVDTWLGSSEHWLVEEYRQASSFMNGYPALYHKFAANVLHTGLADYVVPLPLDSVNAAQVLRHLAIRPAMIHLDGGHDYDSVTMDLRVWWPLLLPGGLLVGDDYYTTGVWSTVKAAFDDFFDALGFAALENEHGKCRVRKPPA